jgi:phosphoribosylaminoimidazole-succinocarboxamide synthase
MPLVLSTTIPGIARFTQGKVRDVYDLGDALLLVATDRISAFDVVLPTGIPDKGRVLTALSVFWFAQTAGLVPNHLLSSDRDVIAERVQAAGGALTPALRDTLAGRSLLVKKCRALPLECVVRGYLAGSAWHDYREIFGHGGEVKLYGIPVPIGLRECEQLPHPLFTPATKAAVGAHDENISQRAAIDLVGAELFAPLEQNSLALYLFARDHAAARGLILADTKFEFGVLDGQIILIDEALTPDSSRFWEARGYKPGRAQPSFDKQFVRDYLETLDWDKTAPGPALPPEIVEKTAAKYRDAYRLLTGHDLPTF